MKLIQNAKFRENCKNIKKEKGKIKLTKIKIGPKKGFVANLVLKKIKSNVF